jgi:hypothetical protein
MILNSIVISSVILLGTLTCYDALDKKSTWQLTFGFLILVGAGFLIELMR